MGFLPAGNQTKGKSGHPKNTISHFIPLPFVIGGSNRSDGRWFGPGRLRNAELKTLRHHVIATDILSENMKSPQGTFLPR
jgi:hypothetical protein